MTNGQLEFLYDFFYDAFQKDKTWISVFPIYRQICPYSMKIFPFGYVILVFSANNCYIFDRERLP